MAVVMVAVPPPMPISLPSTALDLPPSTVGTYVWFEIGDMTRRRWFGWVWNMGCRRPNHTPEELLRRGSRVTCSPTGRLAGMASARWPPRQNWGRDPARTRTHTTRTYTRNTHNTHIHKHTDGQNDSAATRELGVQPPQAHKRGGLVDSTSTKLQYPLTTLLR